MKKKLLLLFNIFMFIMICACDYLYMFPIPTLPMKSITSALFFITGLTNLLVLLKNYGKNAKKYAIFMVIGLFFAMLGDIMLGPNFIIGASLFATGHVFYYISFVMLNKFQIKDLFVWLIVFGITLLIIFIPGVIELNAYLILIMAYDIVITLMFSKSISAVIFNKKNNLTQLSLIMLGAFLFIFSDTMLMFNVFGNGGKIFDFLCLVTYYPAEAILATSVAYISLLKEYDVERLSLLQKVGYRLYQIGFRLLLPLLPYKEPKVVLSYDELCGVLKENQKRKVLIVTDKGIVSFGLVDELKQVLKQKKIDFVIFDDVMPNPNISCIEQAKEFYLANNCDAIIAFGGGSVMDCAKVAGARVVMPNVSVQQMKGLLKINKNLPLLIAIPTTAGTGSETTLAAVVTDEKTHHKYAINDFHLIPSYAFLNYKVTMNLPAHLTSTTGMDALTHAVEAYIGRSTTRYTRRMSLEAVKLIVENLYTCFTDPHNQKARENMLIASFKAGNAFTRSFVGYVHAIAHSLGGKYSVPHGLANAIILPYMLKEYGKTAHSKLAKLAKYSGIANREDSKELAAEKFIQYIEKLSFDMNIPNKVDAVKVEDINELSLNAVKEANPLYPVPKLLSQDELKQIYLNLMK